MMEFDRKFRNLAEKRMKLEEAIAYPRWSLNSRVMLNYPKPKRIIDVVMGS